MSRYRFALPVLVLVSTVQAEPALSEADYTSALKAIRPAATEDRYAAIPWLTSLWDARQKAAAVGKPILLWEMDGHPLGCG